jgi:AraC-like DNA-binding protein
MNLQLNIYAVVLLFAFTQGMIYTVLLIKRGIQEERPSDFWLAGLIVSLCIFNLHWMLGFMGIHVLGQELWFFPQNIGLIIGPIIYYYLKAQINADFVFTRSDFRHFIPFLVYFLYHLSIFLGGETFIGWWDTQVHTPLHIGDIEVIAEYTSVAIYMVASWRLYQKYLLWLPQERSDTEGVRFEWYRHFLWAVVLGVCSAFVLFIVAFWVQLSFQEIWIQRALIGVLIFYISIAGYTQMQPRYLVFDENKENAPKTATEKTEIPIENPILTTENNEITVFNAEKSTEIPPSVQTTKIENRMDAADIEKWKMKIDNLMRQEKLYLNSELTLTELSDKLDSHNSLISNVINAGFEKNFNDFTNEFRVNLFKEKIKDPKLKHLTLLALAFECGFNSKSTFNRAVKKATGALPSDFLQQ